MLTQMVDGREVALTSEEETAIRASWAAGAEKRARQDLVLTERAAQLAAIAAFRQQHVGIVVTTMSAAEKDQLLLALAQQFGFADAAAKIVR